MDLNGNNKINRMNILTPKEKAKELYGRFWRETPQPYTVETISDGDFKNLQFQDWDKNWTNKMAVESALICVDEIFNDYQFFLPDTNASKYWNEVREELIKLYR